MSRWFRFLIAITFGIAAGLVYGWVINPAELVDSAPDSLRIDYKTDYVLMVSEAYFSEKDLALATQRLLSLGGSSPEVDVQAAIVFAQQQGYQEADLARMRQLLEALRANQPTVGSPTQ